MENQKKRIKITVEFVLVEGSELDTIDKVQNVLNNEGYLIYDITMDTGKVVAIESIPDSEELPR